MKNFVICGYSKSGKSTLIKRIAKSTKRNVYGFCTQKFPDRLTDEGLCPVYIYPINGEPIFDKEHLIGLGGNGTHYTNVDAFNKTATKLITTNDANALILMDELGFLEDKAEEFKSKVFEVLNSNTPAVVMMKSKMQFDFMQQLKNLSNVEYIELTEDNRDAVFEHIINTINNAS